MSPAAGPSSKRRAELASSNLHGARMLASAAVCERAPSVRTIREGVTTERRTCAATDRIVPDGLSGLAVATLTGGYLRTDERAAEITPERAGDRGVASLTRMSYG
jgi:hypothetical protein